MRLAFTDAGNDPTSLTTRQAYDLLAQGFGPGFNGPLVVAVSMPTGPASPRSWTGWPPRSRTRPGVADGGPAAVRRRPDTRGRDRRHPDDVAPGGGNPGARPAPPRRWSSRRSSIGTGVVADVGGETASGIDAADFLSSRLLLVIGAVILVSFVLLWRRCSGRSPSRSRRRS